MKAVLYYANQMRRLMHKSMQDLGKQLQLSQLEMELLLFLRNNPDLNTARDAAAYRGFSKSNVSTAVEALEQKGWLNVEPDPFSRRVKRLCLCSDREAEVNRLLARQNEVLCTFTSDFTPEEVEMLHKLLDRMGKNITRALERLEENRNA